MSIAGGEEAIRLRAHDAVATSESDDNDALSVVAGPRRGFDYDAFGARLESLWFQRKALVVDGRDQDAAEQGRQIRAFCTEEGVGTVEPLASALLVEAERFERQGDYGRALDAIDLAGSFDPGRPQTRWARARVLWASGRGRVTAITEGTAAVWGAVSHTVRDLAVLQPVPFVLLVALTLSFALFSIAMALRYQGPLRHEVEEWLTHRVHERVARAGGLAVLLLPLLVWIGTGWLLVYWIAATFRYMCRSERCVALALLCGMAFLGPTYRSAAMLYATTSDPVIRTTLAAADGSYAPDRIVKLRRLVDTHPDEPIYRFLIAGLYKNGRYFEEAFEEYKAALGVDPRMVPAHVNIGNIFYATGQYGEAIANYHRALELDPRSVVALYDLHLAQSEAFRFREAEETLARARALDPGGLAQLFAEGRHESERASVVDARIETGSLWRAAVGGSGAAAASTLRDSAADPLGALSGATSVGAFVAIGACLLALVSTLRRPAARRCARCGRPFCSLCRSGTDHPEACTQCVHVLVHRDAMAAESRTVKLFEIERFASRSRHVGRFASWVLPGAGQLLCGRAARGIALVVPWIAAGIVLRPTIVDPLQQYLGFDAGIGWILPRFVPLPFSIDVMTIPAILVLVGTWLAANVGRPRAREA